MRFKDWLDTTQIYLNNYFQLDNNFDAKAPSDDSVIDDTPLKPTGEENFLLRSHETAIEKGRSGQGKELDRAYIISKFVVFDWSILAILIL